jgi:hypothetical protein
MSDKLSVISKNIHQKRAEIEQQVTAIASYYPDMIKVYVPFSPIQRLPRGWETSEESKDHSSVFNSINSGESSEERSIRRSRQLVYDYILCNRFNLFATITIATDRHNIEHSKQKLNTWLKNQRDRNGKFYYVIVPEYHKDGAIHFHGVFNNYLGKLKESRSARTNRRLTSNNKQVYEFAEYKSGFTKVQYIGDTPTDQVRVGGYIRKYITKEMVSIFGKKRFWASQGLKKPIQEDNPAWLNDIEPDVKYENEHGVVYIYKNLWDKAIPEEVLEKIEDHTSESLY